MFRKPVSVTKDQTAKVPALACPIHKTPDPSGSSCGWWVHWGMSPCIRFGLGPAGPHGACSRAPDPGLAPGRGPGNPPGRVLWLMSSLIIKGHCELFFV